MTVDTAARGWWVTDLAAVAALTAASGYGIYAGVGGLARMALAVPLVVFLPGYALVAALFPAAGTDRRAPGRDDGAGDGLLPALPRTASLGAAERVGLSVALSLAIVPSVALGVHVGPWPIALQPVLVGVVGSTLSLDGLALVRRIRTPADRRFRVSASALLPSAPSDGRPGQDGRRLGVSLPLVAALLLVAASATYALAVPPQDDGFTEFYVETGDVTGAREYLYPAVLDRGGETAIPVAVANREGEAVEYTLVALLQDATVADGERTVEREAEVARQHLAVPANETRRLDVGVTPSFAGEDLRLLVLLYRGDPPADPSVDGAYRVVELVVTVRGDGSAALAAGGPDGQALTGGRPAVEAAVPRPREAGR